MASDLRRWSEYEAVRTPRSGLVARHHPSPDRVLYDRSRDSARSGVTPRVANPVVQIMYARDQSRTRDDLNRTPLLLRRLYDDSNRGGDNADMPHLPITLYAQEQDTIITQVNDRLSLCAYNFIIQHQFPIPVEPGKPSICSPDDRAWCEWVFLLKRLATKRRIPARLIHDGQIRQLVTILENSLNTWHLERHESRPLRDDRNVLQCISSGLQVAKALKDAAAMRYLDALYLQTEQMTRTRSFPTLTPSYTSM